MDLCGGHEEMLDLFASRLRGLLTPHGFEVHAQSLMVVMIRPLERGSELLILSFGSYRDFEPLKVRFDLEGCDTERGIIPVIGRDAVPANDPFGDHFAKARDMIYDWPEVLPQAG